MKNKTVLNSYDYTEDELLLLIPDHFYKYTSVTDDLKKNIINRELWFSSANRFNDPFDCQAHLNYGSTSDECRSNFEKYNKAFNIQHDETATLVWNSLLETPSDFNMIMSHSAAKNFGEWVGITCFSVNYRNTLMWSHYADSHRGIVLEFRKDKNGFLTRNLLPVNYFDSYPIVNVSDYSENQMLSIAYQVICAKGRAWKYENELRVVTLPANQTHKFNENEFSGIVFGLLTSSEVKQEIYDLIYKAGYKQISFKEAVFYPDSFKIKYQKYQPNQENCKAVI